jgi:hypothetical protein
LDIVPSIVDLFIVSLLKVKKVYYLLFIVDEEELSVRVLGERHGHTQGVGRKPNNIAPNIVAPPFQAREDQKWQQQAMNEHMQQQINQLMPLFQWASHHPSEGK